MPKARRFIRVEPLATCELCGKLTETRPYGPNREEICVRCGLQDRAMTAKRMGEYLLGHEDDEDNLKHITSHFTRPRAK